MRATMNRMAIRPAPTVNSRAPAKGESRWKKIAERKALAREYATTDTTRFLAHTAAIPILAVAAPRDAIRIRSGAAMVSSHPKAQTHGVTLDLSVGCIRFYHWYGTFDEMVLGEKGTPQFHLI
jgi:hypothetical protein